MDLLLIAIVCSVTAAIVIAIGYVHFALGFLAMFPVYWAAQKLLDLINDATRPRQ